MSISSIALCTFLCALHLAAQSTAATASKPEALTVAGVIALINAGISDDVIITRLRKEQKGFDLSPQQLIELKKASVSDAVIEAMLDPKAESKASRQESAPTSVATRVVSAQPSGATPRPGERVTDSNDPLLPHDSGIYVYTKDRDGNPRMILLERAAYQGAKTGGMLSAAMTYGIVKAKTRAVIPGPRANIRIAETSPVFYFYFDDKQAGLGKTKFGVANLSNPNQFVLLKLEANKSNRETIIGQFSMLGTSSGSDTKAMIPFKSEQIRAGLYKVTVEDLHAGEYCFLDSSSSTVAVGPYAAYGGGAASPADIFDFGISVE